MVRVGGRVGSVGKHALVMQLRELMQLRYPRFLVARSHAHHAVMETEAAASRFTPCG